MTKTKKIQVLLLCIALIVSCFLTCFVPTIMSVSASSINIIGGYTNVLEDLQKDDNFNADDFPVVEDDYSLQIIQLAESDDKELFIYVYQPSAEYEKLVASSVFISTTERGLSYTNYYLTLLNNQGVFYKYRVDNFFVSSNATRHYEITSIYRPFDEDIDEKLDDDNENIINEVNFKVAKHWIFTTTENGIDIVVQDLETITITDKYVGFVRYADGYTPGMMIPGVYYPGLDSHFVAFKTDRQIDKLMEADVFYTQQHWHWQDYLIGGKDTDWGEIVDKYAYLNYTQKESFSPGGMFHDGPNKYTWDRIQTVDQFIKSESQENIYKCGIFNVSTMSGMTDEGMQDIKGMQWVLRFAETEWKEYTSEVHLAALTRVKHKERDIVGNVSILRLKFETNGITYNLGVIDNKQQGDGNPDNYYKTTFEWSSEFKIFLAILLLILLVVLLFPILPTIFSILFTIIKILLKLAIWLISLPFKICKVVFKKRN